MVLAVGLMSVPDGGARPPRGEEGLGLSGEEWLGLSGGVLVFAAWEERARFKWNLEGVAREGGVRVILARKPRGMNTGHCPRTFPRGVLHRQHAGPDLRWWVGKRVGAGNGESDARGNGL